MQFYNTTPTRQNDDKSVQKLILLLKIRYLVFITVWAKNPTILWINNDGGFLPDIVPKKNKL